MTVADPALDRRVRRRFVSERDRHDPVDRLTELLLEEAPLLDPAEAADRARHLAVDLVGLGVVQELLEDPLVSDVLVNGAGSVWVERGGRLERCGVGIDVVAIERVVERLVGPLGLRADRANPIVDTRLDDGTRVAVVLPPLAVDGPLLAIRRHLAVPVDLSSFADDRTATVLADCVRARRNMVVYGATGAGKTTLVNALVSLVDPGERIVTIEDTAELRLPGDHVVRLEARPGSADGVGRAGMRELVRATLRLRPDRLVVGEVRGAEALDMVWALSTGHSGGFSTCHAGGPEDALRRLETLCLFGSDGLPLDAVRAQLCSAVDVLVGVARSHGGARRVTAVHSVGVGGLGGSILADGVGRVASS